MSGSCRTPKNEPNAQFNKIMYDEDEYRKMVYAEPVGLIPALSGRLVKTCQVQLISMKIGIELPQNKNGGFIQPDNFEDALFKIKGVIAVGGIYVNGTIIVEIDACTTQDYSKIKQKIVSCINFLLREEQNANNNR